MSPKSIFKWEELENLTPSYALVANVDLVIIRYGDKHSVLFGRCHHRGALLADGHIDGDNLICGVHGWDYRYKTGVSEYNNEEALHSFTSWVDDGQVWVDEEEIATWEKENPQPYRRDQYLGNYQDIHGTDDEPFNGEIQNLAKNRMKEGAHGNVEAMGVSRQELPTWDDIQFQTAQLSPAPQFEDVEIDTKLIIGPKAKKPLELDIPLFVSDMSFGALSEEAKIALAKGAEMSGTGICSGEGGMLPEEQAENSRYFYELASAKFGFSMDKLTKVQAFHFKGGQGAKTGVGGHLPGEKVKGKIAAVRELEEGKSAISPPKFNDLSTPKDFRRMGDKVREITGGIPIGFKLSANHIEENIQFALDAGADYIILDGRGGGTGAAPTVLRNHISIPTIPALAKARKYLDSKKLGPDEITLIVTGGLRTAPDFAKALALGADGVAVSNAAIQAIGCLGMRACHTNNCPVGIASMKDHLRARFEIDKSAAMLDNFFHGSIELMKVLTRACGYTSFKEFSPYDLVTWKKEMHHLSGVEYAGVIN